MTKPALDGGLIHLLSTANISNAQKVFIFAQLVAVMKKWKWMSDVYLMSYSSVLLRERLKKHCSFFCLLAEFLSEQ